MEDLPAVTTPQLAIAPSLLTHILMVLCNCHSRSLQQLLAMKPLTALSKPHMVMQVTPLCSCILAAAGSSTHCPGQAGQATSEAQWQPRWHVGSGLIRSVALTRKGLWQSWSCEAACACSDPVTTACLGVMPTRTAETVTADAAPAISRGRLLASRHLC